MRYYAGFSQIGSHISFTYTCSRLCLLTALIECLTVLLEYLDLLQTKCQSKANIWEGLACQMCLMATPLFETTVSCVSHISAILVSDYSCFTLVHSL